MDDTTPYATSSRRRLTRTLPAFDESVTTASSVQAGPSRLPEVTQLVDMNFSEMDRDTDTDDHDTPRLPASSTLPGDTPAARLRALLSRVPNNSTLAPTTQTMPPPDPSVSDEYESDFDKGESINATANSIARESLRDVFSRALRDPGDTPQKAGKRRSNSVEPNDTDETPRFEADRFRMKGKRKSLSDEEIENSHRTPMPSIFKGRGKPLTMEVLEQRYMNGQVDDEHSSLDKREEDEVTLSLLRDPGASPPPATSTPQHSVRVSIDLGSQFQQSNLMDHDSEMQRLVNGLSSYDDQQGMSNGGWFPPSQEPSLEQSNDGHEVAFASNPQPSTSHIPEQASPSVNELRQKRWSFPKGSGATPKRPGTATSSGESPLTSRSLAALNGRKISSPRFSEGSSRSGSLLSDVEQRDRIKDLEEDILRQRERRWNKVTPRRSSMTSLHSNSPQSAERHRTQSEHSTTPQFDTPRSETESPSTNRPIRRYNSLTSNRSLSPTGSIHSVHTEDEPDPELVHLRERNWNSPRPVWPQPVGEQQRALSPGIASTGFYSPHARMRTRTMSTSSVETDDSYNPTSYTSPPSSRTRYTPNGTPSRPHRRNDSSPSLSQPSSNQSRIPVSPSAIRKRTNSAANLLSPPGQDIGRVRPKTVSMSGLRPDLSPSTSRSLSASPNRNADNSRGVLHRPTKIPVKSPRKAIPVPSKMNGAPPISESLREWDGPLGASEEQRKSSNFLHLGSDDDLRIQELTPTLRTVAPPPTGSPERSHGTSPLSSEYLDVPRDGDVNGLNDSTATVHAGPRRSELPTIIDSPPKASSSLALEFASPSPPKDLPALPDPPSTDDESNDGTGWKGFKPSRLFEENKSLLQTPKAPAPTRRPRSFSDTTLRTPPTQGGLAPPPNGANYSTLQTPKPPGGWLATPTPVKPQYVDQSVETDTEGERDPAPMPALQTGLATPSSSLSKGSRVVQTPAAPGAWVNTPGARKSVMKVRFDPDANETREYSKGESDASATEGLGSSTNSQATQTLSPPNTPKMESQTVFSSPKKTPTIRVLDAYGNERTEEAAASPTQAQSVFRIVDALGEAVKEAPLPEDIDQSIVTPAESRDEMLSRVRRGLDDLVSDMHDIDRASALSSSELTRVKELDSASLQAREKRRRLSSDYKKNNSQFKDKFDSLRASMQRSVGSDPSTSSGGKWHFTSPRFFFLVLLQIVLAVVMYRLSDSRVEALFKTAYYDPFEPHLYQHIFKSRLILSTSPERYVSWLSLLDLLQEQGIKACVLQTRDNLSITLANVQSFVWERFGDDGSYFNISWPPT